MTVANTLSKEVRAAGEARVNGSMTRATGVEPLTGTRGLRRSITGGPGARPLSPERPIAAVQNKGGRTFPRVVQTNLKAVRMPASVEALRLEVGAEMQEEDGISPVRKATLFQAWTEAAAQHVI